MDKKNLQDIYRLTPLQEGMLFHSINAPDSGVYIEQFVRVATRLNVSLWEQAWNHVIANNDILRSGFFWEGLDKPVQVVKKQQQHTIRELDWSDLDKEKFSERFNALLEEDKVKPFVFKSGDLMRQTVVHLSVDESYFVWSYHHILLDGWSAFLVMDEVFSVYDSLLNGKTPQKIQRPPFKSYVQWLQLQDKNRDEVFWRDYLKGFSATTPLGLVELREDDAETESSSRTSYTSQIRQLNRSDSAAIEQFARAHRITVNTVIQAVWAYVLAIYSGENDVVFGTTVSGRPVALDKAEDMVGLFINTLPTRIQVQPMQSIGDWLREIQNQQVAVREFEHSALTDIHGWSEVGRAQPLFNSMLAVESFPASKYVDLPDLKVSQKTNYPLTLVVVPGSQLTIRSMFDSKRYASGTIERLVEHILAALRYICSHPDDRVGNISLLNAHSQAQLANWNATDTPYSEEKQLDDFFTEWAKTTPDNTALVIDDKRYTYAELEQRASRIANLLRKRKVRVNDKVAILFEPSFDLIASIIAICKCGCAYAPLDNLAPTARLNTMLRGLGFKTLISHRKLASELDLSGVDCIDLDESAEAVAAQEITLERIERPRHNLIYVIHTSGSTGVPKAAGVYHHAFLNFMEYWNSDFGFHQKDKVLLVNKVTFDLSQKNIWGALMTGGELHLASDKYFDPDSARSLMEKHRITWMNCTPSMAYAIIEINRETYADMRSLRYLFVGGEPVNKARIAPWILSQECEGQLVNTYGPTECTDLCATHRFQREEFIDLDRPVTVGKALPNIRMHVFDRFNNLLPPGISGEVVIGGISIGLGYLNSAEMTAEKFFPSPLDTHHSDRLYRTGDLGYYQEDGSVVVKGRVDFQVKIRGYRIELAEIDSALQDIAWINDSVTVVKGEASQQLVSYIVLENAPEDYREQLQSRLAKTLPEYMLPAGYIALEALPLNDNGKINRAALPEPDVNLLSERERVFEAANPVEEELLAIWKRVLGRDDVGVEDNFFELGGHSLSITQVCSRIRKDLGCDIQISTLFELPNIRQQAGFILTKQADSDSTASSRQPDLPQKMPHPEEPPLSYAQSRLWFLQQFEPGNTAYVVPNVVYFDRTLCEQSLHKTLAYLFARHASLRSCFPSRAGQPYQLIRPQVPTPLSVVNYSELSESERMEQIALIATEEARTEFDLTNDVLARFVCVKTAESEFLLFVTMHHIVTDGWSMDIFSKEIQLAYKAFIDSDVPSLADPELDYIDYTLWQQSVLASGKLDNQVNTLSDYLHGSAHTLALPHDRPRPSEKRYEGRIVKCNIPGPLLARARSFSEAKGCTLFMTLMSVFDVLMYRLSGQDDFNIGSPIANRHHQAFENTLGFFVNTAVFRCQVHDDMPFRELVASVRDSAHKIYDNQDVPFELLVERLNPARSGALQPLFQVMFALQTAYEDTSFIDENNWVSRFDLQVTYSEKDGVLSGAWEFDRSLFNFATVKHFAHLFECLLENLLLDADQAIGSVKCYREQERDQILALLSNTVTEYPKSETIASLFEQQARLMPSSIAIHCQDERLSYALTNECANHFAHQLLAAGIRENEHVAVVMQRGPQAIIAMLAILKAGGAYVAIDPDYPEERICFLIQDAGITKAFTTPDVLESDNFRQVNSELSLAIPIVDDYQLFTSQHNPRPRTSLPTNEHLAYLAYTSGTTGKPKAVRVTQRGVVSLVTSPNYCELDTHSRVIHLAPLAFDASTFEIWGPLLNGGEVVVYSDAVIDLPLLTTLIKKARVDTAFITSGLFNQWMASDLGEDTGLKRILSGGDVFAPSAVNNLYRRDKQVVCANIYGPTENTTFSTWFDIPRDWPEDKDIPIGKNITNSTSYVLDKKGQPVPWGVIGELYVGGEGLALGYHNKPGLTSEKFIDHPFSSEEGARVFATGDRVRLSADGNICFIGRVDSQLKIRGFRIEPEEVRAVIEQHPLIAQALVAAREQQALGKVLVAWFRCKKHGDVKARELRAWLRSRLPDYMLPGCFLEVEQFAVNANGKLDRENLPSPFEHALTDNEIARPKNPMEENVWHIWKEVLQREDFGVECDFFALGGQSLLAVRMSSLLAEHLDIHLPLKQFFSEPTIRGIGRYLELSDWALGAVEGAEVEVEEGVL